MIGEILDNFKAHITAMVPDDLPDVRFEFYDGDLSKMEKSPSVDRRFFVAPDDGLAVLSPASPRETVRFSKAFLVLVEYRTGRSLNDFIRRVHKDVDRMVATLRRPATYGSGTDWALLGRQPMERFSIDLDPQDLSALVTIPFEVIYSVTYDF